MTNHNIMYMCTLQVLSLYSSDDVIIYIIYVSDPTLTVESLVGVMEKVTSDEGRRREVWERVLRWNLVTPSSYLDEVYLKHSTAEGKTHVLADVYVNIRPQSSWQNIFQFLYAEGELAAAKEAMPFLQRPSGGLHVKLCTYMY